MNGGFSLLDAEKAYKGYGCSHFFMCREDPDLYARYKGVGISRQQEIQWSAEAFHEEIRALTDDATPAASLWMIHSSATNLAANVRRIATLRDLYEASLKILDKVPDDDCIMCAENILARNDVIYRYGPVFMSAELNGPALATGFLELARTFADKYSRRDVNRYESALMRAATIRSMLDAAT